MIINQKNINELIECFIAVYGEEYRSKITEKINNCLILLCGYKSLEERKVIKNDINKKYMLILSEKVREIIDLTDQEISFLFGNNIFENNDLIGAFSSTSQKIIDRKPKTKIAQINTNGILKVRNEFLKVSSRSLTITDADKLVELYDQIVNQAKLDYFANSVNYEENKSKLEEYNFLETPMFDLEFYDFEDQKHNRVQINFIKDSNGNTKLFPIITFSTVKNSIARMFDSSDYFDILLIHEINHIIGMHLLDYKDKSNYKAQMGLVETDAGNNRTKYYYMNYIDEVFNQSVAKKVTNLLHNKGIYLIDDPEKSQVNDSSLYEMGEFLLKDFFAMFYGDFLNLYASGGELEKFYSKVDTYELQLLGSLISEYLNRPDILDITDSENLEYEKRAKKIVESIRKNLEKDKIHEVVMLLDLNDLNSITPEKIKEAYEKVAKKLNITSDASGVIKKANIILLESLNYALNNIDDIKNIEGISTNKSNAEMYNLKKTDIFNILNERNPAILFTIITELEKSGIDIKDIIRTINSLEYGLFIPNVIRKLEELFGEEVYQTLTEFTEVDPNDYEKISVLCEQLENYIINSRQVSVKK
jgi:hypothetical protein